MASEKLNLCNSIPYQEEGIVSKELLKQGNGKIILFAFDQGQELSEHTVPFDAFVSVLDGGVTIQVGGISSELTKGESILMPANVPHALKANGRFKMMLCMIKSAD